MKIIPKSIITFLSVSAVATVSAATSAAAAAETFSIKGTSGAVLSAEPVAEFNKPWAMTFLPSGDLLVTTKPGKLWLVTQDGNKQAVSGLPDIAVGGQGGLGDVVLHPDYATNNLVYLSMVQTQSGGSARGAVVVRARLNLSPAPVLNDVETIWTQLPKRMRRGHFSHRIAFGPKGSSQEGKLFITSGDRQEQKLAQRWDMALGKSSG